jgi:CubicO group peptidase (beta-lactamase class C family)
MKKRITLILLLALAPLGGAAAPTPRKDRLDEYIRAYARALDFQGCVLVSRGGEILHQQAYGWAVREWETPHTLGSRFPIASISKPMTALVALRLVEAGAMSLEDRLSELLPDFPRDKGDRITIHQLLTHTAGIGHWRDAPEFEAWKERVPHTPAELIKRYGELPLVAEPGSRHVYSSFGYNLLAFACEAASGKPFAVLLDEYVFKPAGMTQASLLPDLEILPGMVQGYEDRQVDGYQRTTYLHPSLVPGAGGVACTVADLHRFVRYVFASPEVSPSLRRRLIGRHVPTGGEDSWYGYGWCVAVSSLTSSEAYYHGGQQNGSRGEMWFYPDRDIIVAILSNVRQQGRSDARHPSILGLKSNIVRILLGQTPAPPERSIADDLAGWVRREGAEAGLQKYRQAKKAPPAGAYLSELETNLLGYRYYSEKKDFPTALAILQENLADFPKSYNVYDSLAWLYDQIGNAARAREWYLKGLDVFDKFPQENKRWAKDAEAARKRLEKNP